MAFLRSSHSVRSSPRALWSTINNLLVRGRPPPCEDIDLDVFHQFFYAKVAAVRDLTATATPPHFPTPHSAVSLSEFQAVTVDDVVSAICRLPNKYCISDPIPTHILAFIANDVAPFLTAIFNKSLPEGVVPETYQSAYISPLLKTANLGSTDTKTYRPISNLSVTSKLLEMLVAKQPVSCLKAHDLLLTMQSAYRPWAALEIRAHQRHSGTDWGSWGQG